MAEEHVVIVSRATPDGGRAGVRTELPRGIAAKLIVENRAQLASADEAAEYRRELREAKARAEQAAVAERLQVTVISEAELRTLRDRARQKG